MNRKLFSVLIFILILMLACRFGPQESPAPTATPVTEAPLPTFAPGPIMLQDDLRVNHGNWDGIVHDDISSATFEKGSLTFTLNRSNSSHSIFYQTRENVNDVMVSINVNQERMSPDGGFGFICRQQNVNYFYALIISRDHTFSIHKIVDGQATALIPWHYSADIPEDKHLTMQAACMQDQIALWINGKLIGKVNDSDIASGNIGLLVNTGQMTPVTISFDHFSIFKPLALPADHVFIPTPISNIPNDENNFPSGPLLETDDFSYDNGKWSGIAQDSMSIVYYQDGKLWTKINTANKLINTGYNSNQDLSHVIMSADIDLQTSTHSSIGFVCRYQEQSFYFLGIRDDRHFTIEKYLNDNSGELLDEGYSSLIPSDLKMTLQAACIGNELSIGVNGKWLRKVTDDTLNTGTVGLSAGTQEPGLVASFDHFMIYQDQSTNPISKK